MKNKQIKKLKAELFDNYTYQPGDEIFKRNSLFKLWKNKYVEGYLECKDLKYNPKNYGDDMVAVMFKVNDGSYIYFNYSSKRPGNRFWVYVSKTALETTNKMIENYNPEKEEKLFSYSKINGEY